MSFCHCILDQHKSASLVALLAQPEHNCIQGSCHNPSPRIGEYALGFITSSVILQRDDGDEELCSVYVPTNHLYIGDIFLVNSEEIIRPNLSIREGIEIIVSVGMSMPQVISPMERIPRQNDQIRLDRMM
ncbi:protein LIKE COV 2-like [Primulina eburnea]|uniref:protein LIKE COV 2-like n=1 Tax=Primulina eburnea TaxID=1245227 RepID=UPI003C6C4A70